MFLSGMLARGRPRVKADLRASLARLSRWAPAAVWMGGIFYLSHQSAPFGAAPSDVGAIAAHLALYAGLALLLCWTLVGDIARHAHAPRWVIAALAFALTVLYGAGDEVHQAFVPGRSASETDIALDAAGAVAGIALALLVLRLLAAGRRPQARLNNADTPVKGLP